MFIECSVKKLLRKDGNFSFIIPSLFLKGMQYKDLRNLMNSYSSKMTVKEWGDNVFRGVKMPTSVFVLKKGQNKKSRDYFDVGV